MPSASKPAALVFPRKGEAVPPPDAVGRAAADPGQVRAPQAVPSTPTQAAATAPAAAPALAATPAPAGLSDLVGTLEGGDDLVQINVTVPRRIRNALHLLKITGQAKSAKDVTTAAITQAVEQLLAADAGKTGQ